MLYCLEKKSLITVNLWEVLHRRKKPPYELSHQDDAGLLKYTDA